MPESRKYEFTTANVVQTVEAFLDALNVKSFAIYLHDFGAPVGLRFVAVF
jgi:pimeloyl-ACP methyl ester carboxylesterase